MLLPLTTCSKVLEIVSQCVHILGRFSITELAVTSCEKIDLKMCLFFYR